MTTRRRYALWLLPETGAAGAFSGAIEQLRQQYPGPRFAPHVTLIGWMMGDEQSLVSRAARLAAGLKPLTLKVSGFAGEPAYFRCVYARIEPGADIRAAHTAATREFSAGYGVDYRPHVSLHYGQLDAERRAEAIGGLNGMVPGKFTVDRLQLMHIAVAIDDWRPVADFPLQGR